ncbi:hypothetical protein ACFYNM_06810 [Streptomyces spororaveus]|uniref:hypothetical protein n=1 Tax=Streptomyces spororaveus TaxID=284039 RepID=UPI0036C4786A
MQFKRMAVVAAAAVAGQTLLMAAPAMAEEQPAVTAPDVVPEDTAGPSDEAQAPAKEKKQEKAEEKAEQTPAKKPEKKPAEKPGGPAAEKTQAEDTGAQQPAVQAVAAPAAPDAPAVPAAPEAAAQMPAQAAQMPAQAAAPETLEADEDTGSDRILMGPEVTVQGIPADGFKADGSWTPLTVTVDNSGHVAVDEYTPMLGVSQAAGQFGPAHINVEYSTAGGPWTAAAPVQSAAPTLGYALGSAAAIPAGQIRTIDVRISFAADTPVVPFDLTADGRGRVGPSTGSSPTSSYATRITGAPGGDEDPVRVEGPALTVNGLPESVRAGGDWTELSVRVDNAGKAELAAFDLGLVLARPDFVSMQVSQITVEVLRPATAGLPAAWQSVEITSDEDGYFFAGGLVRGPIGAGAAFDVPVRVRFAADAPTGSVSFFAWGTSQVDAETPPPWAGSRSPRRLTTLLEPAPAPGGETPGGGTPGGETPGGGTPGGGTPGGETPGGGTPGGGTPGGETPGGGTPGGGTPGGGTPGGETPGGGTPGGETPGGGTPGGGTPGGETPGGGTPGGETPGGGTPGGGAPGGEAPGGSPGGGAGGETPGSATPGGTPGGAPGGNGPVPNGSTGTTPISTVPNSGSGTGGSGTGGTGGSDTGVTAPLATTGADPATSWVLGGAGVTLAMGAALVAGTGRRRRTN